ncbi:hypothetical protein PFISCL1PPCAC_5101, partial [Pristionchus fissidentatus]
FSPLLVVVLTALLARDDVTVNANPSLSDRLRNKANEDAIRLELRGRNISDAAIDDLLGFYLSPEIYVFEKHHDMFLQWIKKWDIKQFEHFISDKEANSKLQSTMPTEFTEDQKEVKKRFAFFSCGFIPCW